MLGLVAPHDDGEERRLLLPPPDTATRKMARAMPASVCRSSGSSVRLPAKLTAASVMVLPSWDCLAGRSALPLDPGDGGPVAPRDRQGQAVEPTKSARVWINCRLWPAQVPGWLVGGLRLGVGHANYRPARSLHPGHGGRTRLPPRELLAARPRLQGDVALSLGLNGVPGSSGR
jgi:hypothetical protein